MPSVLDILRPSVVKGIINEVKTPYDRFQEFFGMGPSGPNTMLSDTRSVSVDIIDDDRKVANFRAPGADAGVVAPQVVGTRQLTAPRAFERIDLSYEILNNIRAVGENAGILDRKGMNYIKQNMGNVLRRMRRFREFLIWGMLRGSCQFLVSTNDWIPVITGGTVTLDWQVPAAHENQLNGIIGVSWDNAAAPIVTDLAEINAAAEADSGLPIKHAWCNTSRWVKILQNTEVRNLGGSANTPFEVFTAENRAFPNYGGEGTSVGGTSNEMTGRLKGYPSITWHITDRVINLNGTDTKYLGDDEVFFHPEVDQEWTWMYEVKESTNQGYGAEPTDVYGFALWFKRPVDADTAKYCLYGLDNAIPALNPKAIFAADVTP